jgi:hypothetical protein
MAYVEPWPLGGFSDLSTFMSVLPAFFITFFSFFIFLSIFGFFILPILRIPLGFTHSAGSVRRKVARVEHSAK